MPLCSQIISLNAPTPTNGPLFHHTKRMSKFPALFSPVKIGDVAAPNRIFMAPLTRCRATMPSRAPNALNAEYYSQRASAGIIISEATLVAPYTSAFLREPGCYNMEQALAWRTVVERVHSANGRIGLQLYHSGRSAHPVCNQETEESKKGFACVAPSAIAITAPLGAYFSPEGKETPSIVPHELSDDEVAAIPNLFAAAAKLAVEVAGFDFVEIHAANAYLLASFLSDRANHRTSGPYSNTSIENRARLTFEVVDRVIKAGVPATKIGIRLSPLNQYGDNNCTKDGDAVTVYIAKEAEKRSLAYLHIMRADFFGPVELDILSAARSALKKENSPTKIITNMKYTAEEAEAQIASGLVDAVAFGTKFLSNPDLPARFAAGAPLNECDYASFYGADSKGYTDYKTMAGH